MHRGYSAVPVSDASKRIFPLPPRRGYDAAMSVRSIAIHCLKVCVYTVALLAYLRLGGNFYIVFSAGIAYGWFYILRLAFGEKSSRAVNPAAPK